MWPDDAPGGQGLTAAPLLGLLAVLAVLGWAVVVRRRGRGRGSALAVLLTVLASAGA